MESPMMHHPIPAQIANEGSTYGPLNLQDFIRNQSGQAMRFSIQCQQNGVKVTLPKGLSLSESGILKGVPEQGTAGDYIFTVLANNGSGGLEVSFSFAIQLEKFQLNQDHDVLNPELLFPDERKAKIWEALQGELPLPNFEAIAQLPITAVEMYYLLERFAPLIIWNVTDLRPAGDKTLLTLNGVSSHFNVYDRGTCLVSTPKHLYSHERTLRDSIQTARAMADEVYKRGWNIEFAGFEKTVRAVWVKIQELNASHGHKVTISYFEPGPKERRIYREQARDFALKRLMEN